MRIQTRLEPADFLALNRQISRQHRFYRLIPLFVLAVFVGQLGIQARETHVSLAVYLGRMWSFLLPSLLLVAALAFGFRRLQRWEVLRHLRRREAFLHPITAEVRAEEFYYEDVSGGGFTHWQTIQRIVDAPGHLFFFVQPHAAMIVPKRAFPDEASARAFHLRAMEHWTAARR